MWSLCSKEQSHETPAWRFCGRNPKPIASFRDAPDVTYTSNGELQSSRRQFPKSNIKLGSFLRHRHKVACATNPELEANSRYWAPFWNSSNLRYPATHPRSKAHNHVSSSSYRDALCCWATEDFHPATLKTQPSMTQTPQTRQASSSCCRRLSWHALGPRFRRMASWGKSSP